MQSGFARTGRMFGIEHSGVEPDLVTVAKSIAGGFPLSGVIGRTTLMDAVEPGGLGGTYAGSPVACAAALAVLDVIADERLIERANLLGNLALTRLNGFRDQFKPLVQSIRGPGAMIAFDMVTASGAPNPETTRKLTVAALREGLVLLSCGVNANTIRLLFPLVISDAVLAEGLDKLERALTVATA